MILCFMILHISDVEASGGNVSSNVQVGECERHGCWILPCRARRLLSTRAVCAFLLAIRVSLTIMSYLLFILKSANDCPLLRFEVPWTSIERVASGKSELESCGSCSLRIWLPALCRI